MSRRYALVSPCRDEAEYLQITIDTVAAQTVPPTKWLIVDDGSTDDTPRILAEASARHPFIQSFDARIAGSAPSVPASSTRSTTGSRSST